MRTESQQNQEVEDESKEVYYQDEDDFELEEEEDLVSGVEIRSFPSLVIDRGRRQDHVELHLAREANPENFTSRGMNKFKYFTQGVSSIIDGGCKGLAQAIEFLEIDGRLIWGEDLPQVRPLILLLLLLLLISESLNYYAVLLFFHILN